MIEKILLASDGSPSAVAAARWVADLGTHVPGIQTTLLYVRPGPGLWMSATPDGGVMLPDPPPTEDDADLLAPALAVLRRSGIRTRTRFDVGPPAEVIVHIANAGAYDLIAVGRRGLNPLAHLLIGSVSARVVEVARCPVIVVHA